MSESGRPELEPGGVRMTRKQRFSGGCGRPEGSGLTASDHGPAADLAAAR